MQIRTSKSSNKNPRHLPFRLLLISLFILLARAEIDAQTRSLLGSVIDEKGDEIPGATVRIVGTKNGTTTDANGEFEVKNLDAKVQLRISSVGFFEQFIDVDFGSSTNKQLSPVVLKESTTEMEEVVVTASKAQFIEQKAYAVSAIDTEPLQVQNLDINQVLSKVTGVRIRESGGLGSRFNFSLNGLSGNQVKFFINDIPMDVMGRSYSLNNFPVNLIDQVEVYKGVVPVKLGSDALGGAVNILSNDNHQKFLNASYSIGSFNTHRASLMGKHRSEKGFTVSLQGFYNYSDNDYMMYDVQGEVDAKPVVIDAKRFHDAYESKMVQAQAGFTNTSWTDKFMISAAYASLYNEIQTGFSINFPFGEAVELEDNYILSLDYQKQDFLTKNLDLKVFSLFSTYDRTVIDTSSFVYNWQGIKEANINPSWGERLDQKSYFEFQQPSTLNRVNLDYGFRPNQSLVLNYVTTSAKRQGENRFQTPEEQAFLNPNTLNKHIIGLAHEINLFDQNLSIITAFKYYLFNIDAKNVLTESDLTLSLQTLQTSIRKPGYSLAIRYYFDEHFYLKGSFENGHRIPEASEMFGDGLITLANPGLQPEQSFNLNLGGQYHLALSEKSSVQLILNGFNRDVKDFIFERNDGIINQFRNLRNVRSRGLETEIRYQWNEKIAIDANITWQEFIDYEEISRLTGRPSSVFGLRMPNTPFLFGNLGASYSFNPLFKKIGIQSYYSINYVNEFLLNYDILSSDQNKIPTQITQNAGVSFTEPKQRHSLSIEVNNVFNALAFDNFKLQKPGRALYVKWNFFLL